MMPALRSSRLAGVALAAIVAVTTLAIVGNAVQTVTMPNISYLNYNVLPGLNSPDITIPISNSPVLVMASCSTVVNLGPNAFYDCGVAQVTMVKIPNSPPLVGFLEWVGLGSPPGPVVVGGVFPGGPPHIAWLDSGLAGGQLVELRAVNTAAIDVQNLGPVPATGTVKLIW
jgi:hypothetical protein